MSTFKKSSERLRSHSRSKIDRSSKLNKLPSLLLRKYDDDVYVKHGNDYYFLIPKNSLFDFIETEKDICRELIKSIIDVEIFINNGKIENINSVEELSIDILANIAISALCRSIFMSCHDIILYQFGEKIDVIERLCADVQMSWQDFIDGTEIKNEDYEEWSLNDTNGIRTSENNLILYARGVLHYKDFYDKMICVGFPKTLARSMRGYGLAIDEGLTLAELKKIDKRLWDSLRKWGKRHPGKLEEIIAPGAAKMGRPRKDVGGSGIKFLNYLSLSDSAILDLVRGRDGDRGSARRSQVKTPRP